MQFEFQLITRELENTIIGQRAVDGYINATAMCKAVGKLFADYRRLSSTQEFLSELSRSMGIPIDQLIFSYMLGKNDERGTWVHPDIAINLGQWCSPKFAVAVARWVREWMQGNVQTAKIPYHLKRYIANRSEIPPDKWSMLNEMTFNLIAPLEELGYHLPEHLVPDISEGRMFCQWLRKEKNIDTTKLPKYRHMFEDGRVALANLYPLSLLEDFRKHFFEVWLPEKAIHYFRERDPNALEYLTKVLPLPENSIPLKDFGREQFQIMKAKVAAAGVLSSPKSH
jgi:KilA-N domain